MGNLPAFYITIQMCGQLVLNSNLPQFLLVPHCDHIAMKFHRMIIVVEFHCMALALLARPAFSLLRPRSSNRLEAAEEAEEAEEDKVLKALSSSL